MKALKYNSVRDGRTLLAALTDSILFGVLLFAAFYLLLGRSTGAIPAALTLTAALLVPLILLDARQRSQRTEARREALRTRLVTEKLLAMPYAAAKERFAPDLLLCRASVSEDDLFWLMRYQVQKVWLCGPMDPSAQRLLPRINGTLQIHAAEETAARCIDLISESDLQSAWERERRQTIDWRQLLRQWRPNRFLLLGIALLLLSIGTRYRIYYRLLASVCMTVGGTAVSLTALRRARQTENGRTFVRP